MKTIFSVCFILLVVFTSCVICDGQRKPPLSKFSIAILSQDSRCTFANLESKTNIGNISCSHGNGNALQNGDICVVESENSVMHTYICNDGIWNSVKGTDTEIHSRHKRSFWGWFLGGFVSVLVVMTYCYKKHGNILCIEEEVDPKDLVPPYYTNCPPSDLQTVYIAVQGETDVVVAWTAPVGHDDEAVITNEQTHGGTSGSRFKALSGDGIPHPITYTVTDGHSLSAYCHFSVTVKYLTCTAPTIPLNGRLASCTQMHLYGSTCTFSCFEGYEFTDDVNSVTCQESETWTEPNPTCSKVACDTPFSLSNGNVECEDASHLYDSDCDFICDSGFTLSDTQRKMTCQADKTWSVSSSDVNCKDSEAPTISCQSPQVFYADRGLFSTSVIWTTPTAIDNVDTSPVITQTSGPTLGDVLDEGLHYAQYQVTDGIGNTSPLSECSITIEVKVIRCATGPTDALNVSRFMLYNCSDNLFYNGVSCVMSCDLNLPLIGTDTMTCERLDSSDEGYWNWGDEEQPYCEVVECPNLDPPTNGAISYDTVNARPVNFMLCQNGYDISSVGVFTGRMSCQDSGEWYPLSEFPDCIISNLPFQFLSAKLYYEGDCNDEATKETIKQQILTYLATLQADVDNSICPSTDTCSTDNVHVECGEITGKRRRRAEHHRVDKRSLDKRSSDYILVSWNIVVIFDEGIRSTSEAYTYYNDMLFNISAHADTVITNGDFNIDGLTISTDAFTTESYSNFICQDPGYLLEGVTCKPCPSGTYLDSSGSSKECKYCNLGEYMDHAGAVACDMCDEGYSTLTAGRKLKSSCIKKCSAGFYSTTTMEPCSACPVGTYQPTEGQTTCVSCPVGEITQSTNNTSSASCSTFDLLIKEVVEQTELSQFVANVTGVVTITCWTKLQTSTSPSFALMFSSMSTSFLTLWINSTISVGVGTVHESTSALSSDRWTLLVLSIDIPAGEFSLFVDGTLTLHSSDVIVDSSVVSGEVNINSFSSNGLLISGFNLYGRALGTSEITSLLQTCSAMIGNEYMTLHDVHNKLSQNILLVAPSTCDAIDECQDSPCGTHTCINDVDDFTCICKHDMTGLLCDVEPDYCDGNECNHGTCVPGNRTYTCTCTAGYTGVMCAVPPVNGNWSDWTAWTGCDVTCGGGTRARNRECDNPAPGYMGNDCDESSSETETCNTEKCEECTDLKRKIGTIVTCDDIDNTRVCTMTCVSGSLLPSGQRPYEEYRCGLSTSNKWVPIDKLPTCVSASRPPDIGIRTSLDYGETISSSSETAIEQQMTNNLDSVSCRSSGLCSMSTTFSYSKRRSIGTTLTVQFNVELTENGDFGLAEYISDNTTTPAMTEFLAAVNAINELITYIQDNTATVFNVEVDGVQYTVDTGTLNVVGQIQCEEGYAGTDGLCVQCASGTKFCDGACVDCEVGTYQPSQGQSECITCPTGYTTQQYGASDVTECTVIASVLTSTSTSNPSEVTNQQENMTTTGYQAPNFKGKSLSDVIIVVIVLSVVAFILSVISIACLLKKRARRRKRNCATGSAVSLDMVRPSVPRASTIITITDIETSDDAWGAAKVSTNANVKFGPGDSPPSYDSHEFLTPAPWSKK